ncbi:lysosomal alpha-glucosidase [Procambarus clarkii]|uniref:lysosomal alpha-glucosidase n=1 Tax=Procambarus clarkii TaxID=6728 RepID=UPI003743665D
MVQYQTREAKVMTADNLLVKLLHPDEKSVKKHVWHIRVAVALLAGALLVAGIFVFVSGFPCSVKTGITNRQPEYTITPNDLEKAKDYTRWVKSLPSLIICGIDCLFYNLVPENAKDEKPEFLPISKNFHVKVNESLCTDIPMTMRFDCHPDALPSQSSCEERGCCWREEKIPKRKRPFPSLRLHQPAHGPSLDDLPLNVPFCYYPRDYKGYSFINFTSEIYGFNGYLKRETASGYPGDIDTLKMDVYFETETRLRIKITDPSRARWETPIPVVPEVTKWTNSTQYSFVAHLQDGTFTITRKINGLPIFDTTGMAPLIYAEQFLQLSTSLPSDYIYGLGEHLEGLLLDTYWKRRVLWNLDNVPEPGTNLYGSHPFYMVLEPGGNAHGVFLLNSNAQDIVLQPHPALTIRAIGGIIDLYVFLGPTPNAVISQYTEVIGRPFLPPYWSLGYHQCRFGYGSVNRTREVWQRTRNAGIPFDVQWNDIDYMEGSKDFTVDPIHYSGLSDFVGEVHQAGMHYVPIIDPGISAAEPYHTYLPWDEGVRFAIFVRNSSNLPFIGKVWNPVATAWPDFTHPLAAYYWGRQLLRFHNTVPVDGAWIDMNEPSNFLSGSVDGCKRSNFENPYFSPAVHGDVLFYHTLCMGARHHLGIHYNLHNLYGFTETIATNAALQIIRAKRPFIISRSTFPGQGHYGGHWTGDVWSDWFNLWQSISGILNFNMYGIPMVGADICGFNGNTTAELCLRWMQLGAFYPFSRNHNTDDSIDQDPVAMGEDVVIASRNALTQRYMLLPYLYSLFFNAHLTGEPVARPLFFQFHKDPKTYAIDTQFMWGPALMIIPALHPDVRSVKAYVPHGNWYDWYLGYPVEGEGNYIDLDAPKDKIPLLVRGGHILPTHIPANTTTESRKNGIGVIVAPSQFGRASGEFYWDDGDSLNVVENKAYTHVQFISGPGIVNFNCTVTGYTTPINLTYMHIFNVVTNITEVVVAGKKARFQFDEANKVLSVTDIAQSLLQSFIVTWK